MTTRCTSCREVLTSDTLRHDYTTGAREPLCVPCCYYKHVRHINTHVIGCRISTCKQYICCMCQQRDRPIMITLYCDRLPARLGVCSECLRNIDLMHEIERNIRRLVVPCVSDAFMSRTSHRMPSPVTDALIERLISSCKRALDAMTEREAYAKRSWKRWTAGIVDVGAIPMPTSRTQVSLSLFAEWLGLPVRTPRVTINDLMPALRSASAYTADFDGEDMPYNI